MLEVVDPHIHLWDLATGLYPRRTARVAAANVAAPGDYLLRDLMDDANGVKILKAVHVEAFPTDGLAEARHVQKMADDAPSNIAQGIVAYADLSSLQVGDALQALTEIPNVRGIRQTLDRWVDRPGTVEKKLLMDPDWWRGFARLPDFGLTFDMQIRPDQMREAAQRIAGYPNTQVALNHLGNFKDRSLSGWHIWRDGMRDLAKLPNVHLKLSGLAMYDHHPTVESMRPYIYDGLELFGTERCMFASNFPVDKHALGYADLWHLFAETVSDFTSTENDALFRSNAEAFYRL